jgi:glycine dehydrogenase subunit 1
MKYLPLSPEDVGSMLAAIGVKNLDGLFANIPESLKLNHPLDIPPALSEIELRRTVGNLAQQNADCTKAICFAGGTCYFHYIPSAIDYLAALPELLTAYTPYQPELSQGTLTAIFEFQTIMTNLTGHPISNASLYDGSTGVCEAARMAVRDSEKKAVAISETCHPDYIATLKGFANFAGFEVKTIPAKGTQTDIDKVREVTKSVAAVIVQSPNVAGTIEDIEELVKATKTDNTFFVQVITEAISLGMLKRPGDMGVDICTGDTQSYGNHLMFGGPHMGFLTVTNEFLRKIPGRIVGESVDRHGNRSLTLTLRPREQDIKREKATSNICTNNSNTMLRSLIYLMLMGKRGLREVAQQNFDKAHYFADVAKKAGFAIVNDGEFFNEVTVRLPKTYDGIREEMLQRGFLISPTKIPGADANTITVAVTEMITKDEIDAFVSTLKEVTE